MTAGLFIALVIIAVVVWFFSGKYNEEVAQNEKDKAEGKEKGFFEKHMWCIILFIVLFIIKLLARA